MFKKIALACALLAVKAHGVESTQHMVAQEQLKAIEELYSELYKDVEETTVVRRRTPLRDEETVTETVKCLNNREDFAAQTSDTVEVAVGADAIKEAGEGFRSGLILVPRFKDELLTLV